MIKTRAGDVIGDTGPVQRIIRRAQLHTYVGLSIPYVYELIAKGEFPRPIKLGERASGWLESEIAQWQRERIKARDEARA